MGYEGKIRYLADQSNINRILPSNNEFERPINRKTMEFVEAAKIGETARSPAIETSLLPPLQGRELVPTT